MQAQTHKQRASISVRGTVLAIVLLAVGCDQSPAPAPVVPKAVDPHASFAKVLEQLKQSFRGFDEVLSLDLGNKSVRRVKFSYIVQGVTGQVNVPEDPDSGRLTAQVSVHTSTRYMPLDPLPDSESATSHDEDETTDASKTTSTDTQSDASADRLRRRKAFLASEEQMKERIRIAVDASLSERGGERTDVYEFAYEGGRWVLTSEGISEPARHTIEKALTYQ